jgi:GNAT superfamily N-acetyltransferase
MPISSAPRRKNDSGAAVLGESAEEGSQKNKTRRPVMREALPEDGVIRKLWSGEAQAYRDHLLRLDMESRRNRFGGAVSDAFIENYVELSFTTDAVTHGFFVDGTLRGAAELRPLGPALPREAEAAFSIEKPWQSHGVGTALLDRTLLAARNRGYKLLHMACLAENKRMQQLARKFDAELTFDFGSVVGEVEAAHPTPLSLMRELVADSTGFATAMLDVQSRLIRPGASQA